MTIDYEAGGAMESTQKLTRDEWHERKRKKKAAFTALQNLPYEVKKRRAAQRIREFIDAAGYEHETHVSVGGLDSITLSVFITSLGYDVPAISCSSLEDKSIQEVHRALGVTRLQSYKTKVQVLNEVGFPVISKKIAGRIDMLQHANENNKTVRHAIITGECGAQGHFAKNSRMQLPQKWLKLFGGWDPDEGQPYKHPDFKVSKDCCYWLKEKPADDWARENNSWPFLGIMASEGGQREEALIEHGCNYFGASTVRSAPFAPFMRQDVLQLALEMDKYYHDNLDVFEKRFHSQPYGKFKDGSPRPYVPVKSIIPEIYGGIGVKPDGKTLYTRKAQRTGCSMCGFGIHLEERPHRFDRLREMNEREWRFWMYECCLNPVTGKKYGWGKVLDYIGVEWEEPPQTQISIFDFLESKQEVNP